MLNELSPAGAQRLLAESGFEIVRQFGFGLLPPTLYRTPLRRAAAAENNQELRFQINSVFGLSIPVILRIGPPDVWNARIGRVRAGGMEAINLKISKIGGLTRARQIRELAETLGIRLTIEEKLEPVFEETQELLARFAPNGVRV